jgi:hypothetical protein
MTGRRRKPKVQIAESGTSRGKDWGKFPGKSANQKRNTKES